MKETKEEKKQRRLIGYVTADKKRFTELIAKIAERYDGDLIDVWNLIMYTGAKVFRQGIGLGGGEITEAFCDAFGITPAQLDIYLEQNNDKTNL